MIPQQVPAPQAFRAIVESDWEVAITGAFLPQEIGDIVDMSPPPAGRSEPAPNPAILA
jgi:hypothetical protein